MRPPLAPEMQLVPVLEEPGPAAPHVFRGLLLQFSAEV